MAMMQMLSRRSMVRLIAGSGLSLTALSGWTRGASAGIAWCRACTMIELDGKMLTLFFDTTDVLADTAEHPIEIVIEYPATARTPAKFEQMDNGFGQGYLVTLRPNSALEIVNGRHQISVATRVRAQNQLLPLNVEAARGEHERIGLSYGKSNTWVQCPSLWL